MKSTTKHITALYFKRIGDSLIAIPTLRAVRQNLPTAHLSIISEPQTARVFENNPIINDIVVVPAHASALATLKQLRATNPDLVLDFMSNGKTAFATCFSGARIKIGIGYPWRKWVYDRCIEIQNHHSPVYSVTHKLGMAKLLDINTEYDEDTSFYVTREDTEFAESALNLHGWSEKSEFIAVNVLSRRSYKKWPIEFFAKVVRSISLMPNKVPILLSTPDDDGSTSETAVLADLSKMHILKIPDLGKLAAVLGKCKLLIGNDGGAKHLAIAMKTPTITIFGFEPYEYWTPKNHAHHIAISKWDSKSTINRTFSIIDIGPEEVMTSVEKLLKQND